MKNNIINYFKLSNIINIKIKQILENKFKERWLIEIGKPWVDCKEYGELIYKFLCMNPHFTNSNCLTNDHNFYQKSIISNGNLNSFNVQLLSSLLINFNFTKINDKEKLSFENKQISSINQINDNFILIKDFKIEESELKNIKQNLINILIEMNDYLKGELEDTIQSIETMDIVNIQKPQQSTNKIPNSKSNLSNKTNTNTTTTTTTTTTTSKITTKKENKIEESIKLKELGNIEYTKKNYNLAIEYYTKGIDQLNGYNKESPIEKSGMDLCELKSLLYLNRSISKFEYYKLSSLKGYEKVHLSRELNNFEPNEFRSLLEESKIDSFESMKQSPLFYRSYFRLSQILSFQGKYNESIQFLGAADQLNPSCKEVTDFKKLVNEKLNYRNSTLFGDIRNFENEAKLFIEKHKFNSFFKGYLPILIDQLGMVEEMISTSLSQNRITINHLNNVGEEYMFEYEDYRNAYKYFSKSIKESNISNGFFHLSTLYLIGVGVDKLKKDSNIGLSLLYEASLKPLHFDDDDQDDYGDSSFFTDSNIYVLESLNSLGYLFQFGIDGIDIDLEKSEYYYELGVKYSFIKSIISYSDMLLNCKGYENKEKSETLLKKGK
ncbi:hypothetical protein DDB_G0289781 [Dictyostelium discoideum AX4]|uniref:Uncharacterized protein n=1 Tax=Dictyostelium discoideum TaxID=44689 RepID=Q54H01_DICDI|nr:hypothetical protein DDB_G0289781 [Dictyostelium discoideum AX4]EAL62602.1 hypothetical protein DDB_G0289781 [Dictyostelium discoideum AX4]|eukprot:XP_636117.1 hypothetical protein DDB_G0289781 [Dictyostelium discoideum AX4]